MKKRYQAPMVRTARLEVNEMLAGSKLPSISDEYSDLELGTETNHTVWDDLW